MLAPGMTAVHESLQRPVRHQQVDVVGNLLPLEEAIRSFQAREGPVFQGWDVGRSKDFVAEQLDALMLQVVDIVDSFCQQIFEKLRVAILLQILQLVRLVLKLDQALFESLRIKRKLVISGDDDFLAIVLLLDPLRKLLRFFACAPHSEVAGMNEQVSAAGVQPVMEAMRV